MLYNMFCARKNSVIAPWEVEYRGVIIPFD